MTLFNIKSLSVDNSLWVQCANNKLGGGKMHPGSTNVLQQLGCVKTCKQPALVGCHSESSKHEVGAGWEEGLTLLQGCFDIKEACRGWSRDY